MPSSLKITGYQRTRYATGQSATHGNLRSRINSNNASRSPCSCVLQRRTFVIHPVQIAKSASDNATNCAKH